MNTPRPFLTGDIVRVKGSLNPYTSECVGIICARSDNDFGCGLVPVRITRPPHLPPLNYPAERLDLLQACPRGSRLSLSA